MIAKKLTKTEYYKVLKLSGLTEEEIRNTIERINWTKRPKGL